MDFQHSKRALTEENLYRDCLEQFDDSKIVLWWKTWISSRLSGKSSFFSAIDATVCVGKTI